MNGESEERYTHSHIDEIVAKYIRLKAELNYIKECREKNIDIFHRNDNGTSDK